MPQASKSNKNKGVNPPSEKALLHLLKQHLLKDYPNPQRRGCPPEQSLARLARKPLAGKSSLVRHLFHCSPCYLVYSNTLRQVRRTRTTHTK